MNYLKKTNKVSRSSLIEITLVSRSSSGHRRESRSDHRVSEANGLVPGVLGVVASELAFTYALNSALRHSFTGDVD